MTMWNKIGLWEALEERLKNPEAYSKAEVLGAYALMFDYLEELEGDFADFEAADNFDPDEYSRSIAEKWADPMNGGGTILLKVSDLNVDHNDATEEGKPNYSLLRGHVDVGSFIDWSKDPASDFRDAIEPNSEIEIMLWGKESISASLVVNKDGESVRRFLVRLNDHNFYKVLRAVHRRQAFLTKVKAFSFPIKDYVEDWVEILGSGLVRPDLNEGPGLNLSLAVDRVRRVEDPGNGMSPVIVDLAWVPPADEPDLA